MATLAVDLETYSSVDLTKCGVYPYTEADDFQVLLFAYAFDDQPVQIVDLAGGELIPDYVCTAMFDASVLKTAWNANFERTCLSKHMCRELEPSQWSCTMVWAMSLGLPAALELAAKTLKTEAQKASVGRALIRLFSCPHKAAKGGLFHTGSRVMPEDQPEKWAEFRSYCMQDVETERAIRNTLAKLSPAGLPEAEKKLWCLDQRINDTGVLVEKQLVDQAIKIADEQQAGLMARAVQLTGLNNPKSVSQLKKWLKETDGIEVESLNKQVVPDIISQTGNGTVKEVLELRQEMSKSSVAKYDAMERSMCSDGRIRGLFQFYGARSGRWSGRNVQVQNLPQNHLEDLDLARELVLAGRGEDVELLFGSVSDTLSQLIRTAFIPSPGCKFVVADYSAIEARIIAWLAGEQWRMEVFATHGKIYEASASAMFKVPMEEITKGSPLRQKGKISELACIAEGQIVLTDHGPVAIEEVQPHHKVWDGIEFVNHQGVVFRGNKEVITYGGLTATADHSVWVAGQPLPVRLDYAAASGAHLIQSGVSWQAVRVGEDHQLRETLGKELESLPGTDRMHRLQECTVDLSGQSYAGQIQGLPILLPTSEDTAMVGQEADRSQAEMHEPKRPGLSELRETGDRIPLLVGDRCGAMGAPQPGERLTGNGDGPDRQRGPLRARQSSLRTTPGEPDEPAADGIARMGTNGVALFPGSGDPQTVRGDDPGTDPGRGPAGREAETQELERYQGEVRVYDILNCGPRHRFTVSGVLVHNCGYGGSVGALKAMDAKWAESVPESELKALVTSWRGANQRITQLWWDVEAATRDAILGGTRELDKGIRFTRENGLLLMALPSGRSLSYVRPRLEPEPKFNREGITFEGMDQVTKKWRRIFTYGPKLVENIVQAIARDCLAEGMLRLAADRYRIVMHVHDEVVLEVPKEIDCLETVCSRLGEDITWAPGLLLKADGFECEYYKKD